MPRQILGLLCIAIKQDMAEAFLARPCHDGKEIIGNALVGHAGVFIMGVEEPAVIGVAPSDAGPFRAGCIVENFRGCGGHMTGRDGHECADFECRHQFRPFPITGSDRQGGAPSGSIHSDCWMATSSRQAHIDTSVDRLNNLCGFRMLS
ncbi:hypothetical protein [Agrobacterium tumefaciens]|uniref:hypothetical protein n=1 Tax=Agrobacterium tumefaciens TaxID=358 RepID=UPI00157393A0|nr:hypothetical protein [Agrobacterium tumefaciens]